MEIIKEANGDELIIKVVGRLDTNSSPKLEEEIKNIDESVTTLILDFEQLIYVSSSGLRIVLGLQKSMSKKGKLIIRNLNDIVKEIFDITGFSSILTIE